MAKILRFNPFRISNETQPTKSDLFNEKMAERIISDHPQAPASDIKKEVQKQRKKFKID